MRQAFIDKKARGEKIAMLTAYDYPTAVLADRAGIDMVLVGDSLANVVLGLETTRDVGMEVMLHHAKAVRRGVKKALVIGDMPFEAYQIDPSRAIFNAKRFTHESCCQGVKVEWFDHVQQVIDDLSGSDVPFIGHVGLTPQTAEEFTVRGKSEESAKEVIEQARVFEQAGCFAVVLECIPEQLAKEITAALKVPTIGIGAGKYCDGQVLVLHDMLGLNDRRVPKFVKRYASLGDEAVEAIRRYVDEVRRGDFPGPEQTFH